MSRLNQLRKLLSVPKVTTGRIHQINGDSAIVSTSKGSVTAKIASGLSLSIQDKVKLQDGLVISKVRAIDSLPVYDV